MITRLIGMIFLEIILQTNAYSESSKNIPKEIVIIGAGLAGLTTAYRLHQKGYHVNVYEARPRIGGRVHSVLLKNYDGTYSVAELGGQNISDGGEAHHFLALSREFGLEIIEDEHEFSRLFYDGSHYHEPRILMEEQKGRFKEIKHKLDSNKISSKSIQHIIDNIFPRSSILNRIFTFQMTSYEGSPPSKLCLYHNLETLTSMILSELAPIHRTSGYKPTMHLIRLKGGNANLPLKISEQLQGKIYLNHTLIKVSLTDSNKLMLTFKNGKTVFCDKLILSIPCPVYEDIKFENDTIPENRLLKIRDVQYGTNGKILVPLKYDKITHNVIFNDKMATFFNDDRKLLNIYYTGKYAAHLLLNLKALYNEATIVIRGGVENSKLPTELPVLPREEQLTLYSKPIVKSWYEDPFSKGSYSNFGLNSPLIEEKVYHGIKVKALFEPISDKIYFAGEHTTILDEIGTMEAAVESGERIAHLISTSSSKNS
ncbi:MAG: FAD-dependent oxidoreductase [Candidatus Paracaedimonas acanthamoebae]|uniref:Tryptophan 2-monooxygenase n=1 Tax=Candidatus Paracaedimonas acanthamoebae TaxID=244581 RepID=A0A8J7PR63_9PROT|nr:FAD-dependent oxidoreductase [Candidatus Paracaedimonas acanthamoebae]